MAGKMMLMRKEVRPRPHDRQIKVGFELDNAVIDATMIPVICHDEGLGAPDTYNSHPQHASFAVAGEAQCFVNSRVNRISAQLEVGLSSKALDDNLPAVKFGYMVIATAFEEKLDAKDELTGSDIEAILELQYETTDRQTYPLFNGTDMAFPWANSGNFPANQLGLTTDTKCEGITFDIEAFYDSIDFYTTAGLIRKLQFGLKWITLSKRNPYVTIPISIKSRVKRINEYAFLGVLMTAPVVDSQFQSVHTTDITAATQYVHARLMYRYDEWNLGFDHDKV